MGVFRRYKSNCFVARCMYMCVFVFVCCWSVGRYKHTHRTTTTCIDSLYNQIWAVLLFGFRYEGFEKQTIGWSDVVSNLVWLDEMSLSFYLWFSVYFFPLGWFQPQIYANTVINLFCFPVIFLSCFPLFYCFSPFHKSSCSFFSVLLLFFSPQYSTV